VGTLRARRGNLRFLGALALARILASAALAVSMRALGLGTNLSRSMPIGLYRAAAGPPSKGDIVTFCLDESNVFSRLAVERGYLGPGGCPSGLQPLLKRLVGLPGDVLDAPGHGALRVNGSPLPGAGRPALDSAGRPLPESLLPWGPIPPGQALVLSDDSPMGLDGRHFGLVPLASLTRVEPIMTFAAGGGG
jgi:conjugative transfer signal peptidase TraF